MSSARLTPTSYLVLGMLAREGPSTSYDLERHVAATLGHFWSFPHTLLYSEPARLATLGLVGERRETSGRQRRIFEIAPEGRAALVAWLDRPSVEPTELRDPGLLQLFFADLASASARLRLAREQLAIHEARLAGYREDARRERVPGRSARGQRTFEQWRGETLVMGELYEAAAVRFWQQVVEDAARRETDPADDSA
jgi:PadR family transcriptional regulator, regulatory protein AphA